MTQKIWIKPDGAVQFIYEDEHAALLLLGSARVQRASHVEPEPDHPGWFYVDLSPSGGPIVRNFPSRSVALAWEKAWLEEHLPHEK